MAFKFEKDAKSQGISDLVCAVVILTALCAIQYFGFSKKEVPFIIVIFVWGLFGYVVLPLYFRVYH